MLEADFERACRAAIVESPEVRLPSRASVQGARSREVPIGGATPWTRRP